ncbi:MAG: PKD domain-containing protein, partial [Bacteroidota bacterium]
TVTDANGCTMSTTVTVTTPNPLTASATGVNVDCFGNLTGSATVTASGGTAPYTYLWNNNGSTASISGLAAGSYSVVITDANGCTTTASVTITQPAQLIATSSQGSTICIGATLQVTGFATGGTAPLTYSWSTTATGSAITVTPTMSTSYILTVTDANGCSDTATTTIIVNPLPQFLLLADDSAGCVTHCVNFTPSLTTGTFSWTFGDGGTSTSATPSHCYTTTGAFNVGLTIIDQNGCSASVMVNQMINVFPLPVADFNMSSEESSILEPNICFTDASVGASIYSWDFGDPLSSSNNSALQNPCHTYTDTGTYCITLWVENADGCRDSIQYCLIITPDFTFYAPNAFTPDGDGNNDDWYPKGTGWDPDEFEMYVFDRWGNMIFFTDNINKHWDGRVMGHEEIVQEDVYVWKVVLKDFQGGKHQYVGHVSVIK